MHLSLYDIRKKQGKSLRKLSALTGVPVSTINGLELGKVCTQVYHLQSLARELETTIEALISEPSKRDETLKTSQPSHKDEVVWWWETTLKV